ncbi:MAG: hypothetical protein C0599_06865 [Salinivirgaceae bacterium]|nr:MAG: hypothetical protein C0599_06865 [Salinivirgaceae bacterium]
MEEKLQNIADQMNIENDMIHFLFLIGIHESGRGFREYSKEEKTDLIELGGATVLYPYGYYEKMKTDSSEPYYVANPNKKLPNDFERETLIKKGIIAYFSDKL